MNGRPGMMLGKLDPKFHASTLLFKDYLKADAPPAPPEKAYWEYRVKSWPMFMNDKIGCCAGACPGHMVQNWTAHTGTIVTPTDADVLALYEAVGGYVPGNQGTDNGMAITDVCAWWVKNPLAGVKIDGWASVDVTKREQLLQAIYLFGGVNMGFQVPASAMDQFQAGLSWDITSNDGDIEGGHCVPILGYGADGCAVVTWGKIQYMSWAFFEKYVDEAYPLISMRWLNSQGISPSHLNLAAMDSDLLALKAA